MVFLEKRDINHHKKNKKNCYIIGKKTLNIKQKKLQNRSKFIEKSLITKKKL